jgi:hypothetical protein
MECDNISTKAECDINVVILEDGAIVTMKQVNSSDKLYLRYQLTREGEEKEEIDEPHLEGTHNKRAARRQEDTRVQKRRRKYVATS